MEKGRKKERNVEKGKSYKKRKQGGRNRERLTERRGEKERTIKEK